MIGRPASVDVRARGGVHTVAVLPPSHRMRLEAVAAVVVVVLAVSCVAEEEKKKEKVKKLQIGVKKRVDNCTLKSRRGDLLHMHYAGKLEDGTEFDSSYPRGQPLTFTLGSGQVIRGWDQGLIGMCEGEKRKLVIPSDLGYGASGAPPKIPPHATLVFEVELLKIERKEEL
ncbi:peptidyl-prolyl cis-trans isomerase FKBP2-like [Eriocheir sinensis]|uniref:peptidyl-prolyl cis-trans isomerase FKBP2-like n=1 Tax=Eriocheir sinensis TaxID=95602 RepID=UPI0021C938E7|nr:peptidyl-prolyl cis-trans isomerase FKBP2-like [Eriocheir sinensis]